MNGVVILRVLGSLMRRMAIIFGGAVDDIWQKPSGELIVVDVKATSKNVFDWDDTYSKWEYAKGYQRQLEMYQWLLKKNGFEVAKEGYLVYFNGKKNEPMFNQKLEFDVLIATPDMMPKLGKVAKILGPKD